MPAIAFLEFPDYVDGLAHLDTVDTCIFNTEEDSRVPISR